MFDRYYLRRLDQDLETWAAHGWVSDDGAAAIRRHVEAGAGRRHLPGVLGSLGTLLIAASLFAFVAANWDGVPRIGKVGLVYLLLAGTLAGAWAMSRAGMRMGADAATTLATLVFGGGGALGGQRSPSARCWRPSWDARAGRWWSPARRSAPGPSAA